MGNTPASRSSLAAVPEKPAQESPADDAPLLVLLGLVSTDGAGELGFCSKDLGTPYAHLLDTSKAWDPDGDGDLAMRCPNCRSAHWTISFVRFLQESDCEELFSGGLAIGPELLLASTIDNLRAKAAAKDVAR